jgi:hypothetical protein
MTGASRGSRRPDRAGSSNKTRRRCSVMVGHTPAQSSLQSCGFNARAPRSSVCWSAMTYAARRPSITLRLHPESEMVTARPAGWMGPHLGPLKRGQARHHRPRTQPRLSGCHGSPGRFNGSHPHHGEEIRVEPLGVMGRTALDATSSFALRAVRGCAALGSPATGACTSGRLLHQGPFLATFLAIFSRAAFSALSRASISGTAKTSQAVLLPSRSRTPMRMTCRLRVVT